MKPKITALNNIIYPFSCKKEAVFRERSLFNYIGYLIIKFWKSLSNQKQLILGLSNSVFKHIKESSCNIFIIRLLQQVKQINRGNSKLFQCNWSCKIIRSGSRFILRFLYFSQGEGWLLRPMIFYNIRAGRGFLRPRVFIKTAKIKGFV